MGGGLGGAEGRVANEALSEREEKKRRRPRGREGVPGSDAGSVGMVIGYKLHGSLWRKFGGCRG